MNKPLSELTYEEKMADIKTVYETLVDESKSSDWNDSFINGIEFVISILESRDANFIEKRTWWQKLIDVALFRG